MKHLKKFGSTQLQKLRAGLKHGLKLSKQKALLAIQSKRRVYVLSLLIVILVLSYEYFFWEEQFNDYLSIGPDLSSLNQKSIDLIVQLNTFLLTLSAALFALLGLVHGSKKKNEVTLYLMVLSATLISVSLFFGYKSIYEILNQISQGQIALTPKTSEAIMFLSKEFYHFLAAIAAAGLGYISQSLEEK